MGKLKVKMSTVNYADISERDKKEKRTRKLIWLLLILSGLNFAWDVLDRQNKLEYNYNKILEKVQEMRD